VIDRRIEVPEGILPTDDLPDGWTLATAGSIADVVGGGTPKSSEPENFSEVGHSWITPADLSRFRELYIRRGRRDLSEKGLRSCSAVVVPAGTVLMSSRAPIGYVAIAANDVCTNQGFKSFVCASGIDPEFVYFWLKLITPHLEQMGSGSTFTEISGSRARDIPILLAPTCEQRRIAAQIKRILPTRDCAQIHLSRVPAILKRFHQAVLAAACSGRLTEDWRNGQIGVDAFVFLEHLLDKREKEWKAHQNAAPGKRGGFSYPKPFAPQTEALPEIPKSWVWTTLDQLIIDGPQNGLYKPQTDYGKGLPILRIEDFQDNWVRERNSLSRLRVTTQEADVYGVKPGDLLINRVNSPSHIGKSLVISRDLCPAVFESNMMRMHFANGVQPLWIAACLRSADGKTRLTGNAKWAVNQVSINQSDVRSTAVPLPPMEEQREIIARMDALFTSGAAIEKRVAVATSRSERLTQSILARAFRGELVPTEAELARREGREYEPASVLVERIKKERVSETKPSRMKRGVRKANARV
jgi:type I restriction enzyme S subunit